MSNSTSLNFGSDFSGSTTLGPVASALLGQLREGPQTLEELREASGRSDIRRQLQSLVERGLVHESVRGEVVRFTLSSKSSRHLAASIRDVNVGRRMGVVVAGVPERNPKLARRTATFGG